MAKRMSRYPSDRKVYVGDLGNNAKKNDLEYAFGAYGTLRSVWIARNPPGFAFVEFESARDAADAVRGLDGRTVCGRRARVELSTGKFAGGGDRRGGGGGGGGDRRGDGGGGRGGPGGGGGGMRDRPRRNNADETKCYECGGRGHYARECRRRDGRRGSRRRSNSRSRSRSASRNHRSRSRTPVSASRSRSRSRSISANKIPRKSRDVSYTSKTRENGRGTAENGSSYRYSEGERNGGGGGTIARIASPIPKRRYDESVSPSPRRHVSKRSRRGDSTLSRSSSRRD